MLSKLGEGGSPLLMAVIITALISDQIPCEAPTTAPETTSTRTTATQTEDTSTTATGETSGESTVGINSTTPTELAGGDRNMTAVIVGVVVTLVLLILIIMVVIILTILLLKRRMAVKGTKVASAPGSSDFNNPNYEAGKWVKSYDCSAASGTSQ